MKTYNKKVISAIFNSNQVKQKALRKVMFREDADKQHTVIPDNQRLQKEENFILRIPSV